MRQLQQGQNLGRNYNNWLFFVFSLPPLLSVYINFFHYFLPVPQMSLSHSWNVCPPPTSCRWAAFTCCGAVTGTCKLATGSSRALWRPRGWRSSAQPGNSSASASAATTTPTIRCLERGGSQCTENIFHSSHFGGSGGVTQSTSQKVWTFRTFSNKDLVLFLSCLHFAVLRDSNNLCIVWRHQIFEGTPIDLTSQTASQRNNIESYWSGSEAQSFIYQTQ